MVAHRFAAKARILARDLPSSSPVAMLYSTSPTMLPPTMGASDDLLSLPSLLLYTSEQQCWTQQVDPGGSQSGHA